MPSSLPDEHPAPVLATELQTFEQALDDLLRTDESKFVLIYQDALCGVFDSRQQAIAAGYDRFGNVPFLTRQVSPEDAIHAFAVHPVRP
jgi:hypothetical protein